MDPELMAYIVYKMGCTEVEARGLSFDQKNTLNGQLIEEKKLAAVASPGVLYGREYDYAILFMGCIDFFDCIICYWIL